jgi:hypothetical protein
MRGIYVSCLVGAVIWGAIIGLVLRLLAEAHR